jgi:catechol 2,3-dioxygenase-like lactoylglutathione lyase family enzyme
VSERTRPIGINHVALEVADVDEALTFYGAFLELEICELGPRYAFVDLGDQVLAFFASRRPNGRDGRRARPRRGGAPEVGTGGGRAQLGRPARWRGRR